MLRYHVAYYLPKGEDKMVVADVLDFPGAFSQGFDLQDACRMVADALAGAAQSYLEEGRALPMPNSAVSDPDADLVELLPLTVEAGIAEP
jgi:predicted RNase H-like HicB family nuclease